MSERPTFIDIIKPTPTIEELESRWPSTNEQNKRFLGRMWETRTPELLDRKIADYVREEGAPSERVRTAYRNEKVVMTELFGMPEQPKRNFFYHGTGALKYAGEKYAAGGTEREKTVSVLERICADGLRPHFDQWAPTKDASSVSLAESYLYAKWYASKYMSDGNAPEWQLGDPNDFFPFFVYDSFKRDFFEPKHWPETGAYLAKHGKAMQRMSQERTGAGRNRADRFVRWLSSFHSDMHTFKDFNDQLDAHSDIPNNFGVILCIDKAQVDAENNHLILGVHEQRAVQHITPSMIRAVGVPLRHVEEVTVMVPPGQTVFALESADLHFAAFNIHDLMERTEGKQ